MIECEIVSLLFTKITNCGYSWNEFINNYKIRMEQFLLKTAQVMVEVIRNKTENKTEGA